MKISQSILYSLLILVFVSEIFSFDNKQFEILMSKIQNKEYAHVEEFLNDNKEILKENPEYYVILLNYVLSKGDQTSLTVAKGTPEEGDLSLTDPDSNKVVGFIGPRGGYDEALILDGINRTRKALPTFTSRLDIHFGIVTIAEKIKRWDILSRQLENMLKTSREINNKWIWGTVNSMEGDPEEFLIQNILNKTAVLFRTETKEADEALEKVSRAMIKYYPNKIYGYANLGTLFYATKDYQQSEKYYKKAIEIDPNDEIVLDNLKKLSELMNQNNN